ncbi:UNVERIFIED_CONTAM: hypothetical protein PYX00_005780 [Menopon gallinae]|uniref:RING-type E3 ubiquitin transferase n=1 Tax=Menopon gallinae TaxID=328185 RepID=A0AAW2HSU0_9NEOP
MDEWMLNDLLECSVCLERLDTSSKVLPCQHTFCKKCLEEIVSTHKELRCPECRTLVEAQIDDLPPNVLLMRILEGMRNAGNPAPKKKNNATTPRQPGNQSLPVTSVQSPQPQTVNNTDTNKLPLGQKQAPAQVARAIYDYLSKESGDLNFKKGDIITLHRKVDNHWYQGECKGKTGIFPASYVQIMVPLPIQVPKCKALYDFRRTNDDGCLSFFKNDIITVIKRVDENWAEGKLNGRVGIFPLAFVEMNSVARALMKLSINSQPGPSRVAPPTPTADDSTPLIPTDHSGVISNFNAYHSNQPSDAPEPEDELPNSAQRVVKTTVPTTATTASAAGTESSSTVSSSTCSTSSSSSSSSVTPSSSSNTSSTSNSAPHSPPSNQHPYGPNPFLPASQTPRHMILQTSHITNSTHSVLPTSHITAQYSLLAPKAPAPVHGHRSPSTSAEEAVSLPQQSKEKRHSFTVSTPNHSSASNSNRHSAEIISTETPVDVQNGQLSRHGSQRHRRSGSDLPTSTNLPADYIALYPYKPQKADELELKRGNIYLVTERCQDGWFKGTSSKTQKCGVFPGNYVTLAKPLTANQTRVGPSREAPATPSPEGKDPHQSKSPKPNQLTRQYPQNLLVPPELPPRASSPSSRHLRGAPVILWPPPPSEASNSQKASVDMTVPLVGNNLLSGAERSGVPSMVSPPPNAAVTTPSKSAEKGKEKKEKNGLMKRLKEKTSMKRSKSPPATTSYSMDNPVFDDSPASPFHSQTPTHPVHMSRQLDGYNGSRIPSAASSSHRKSNSLDAGDSRKPRQLVPPVRERFRCIVPYPPNSEYELELRVGDIIYVHKKREDGWYKGTQKRTGRTGLFPASFVETD